MKKTIIIFLLALPLGMHAMEEDRIQREVNEVKATLHTNLLTIKEECEYNCALFKSKIMHNGSAEDKEYRDLIRYELELWRKRNEEELATARKAIAELREKSLETTKDLIGLKERNGS